MPQAHEIWQTATTRGDGEKLATVSNHSAELFNSYGRTPKSDDYPNGTGNLSPVFYYLRLWSWLFSVNPKSAHRLHRMVDAEIKERCEDASEVTAYCLRTASMDLLTQATEAIRAMNSGEMGTRTDEELMMLEGEIADVEYEVGAAKSAVRAERRRREAKRFQNAG